MQYRTRIVVGLLAALALAGAVAWIARKSRIPAPPVVAQSPALTPAPTPAPTPRAEFENPPPKANPARLRRLLATRLGHPKILRIEDVRMVRDPRYAGVACGRVAWGDVAERVAAGRRFIATRRNLMIEGRDDLDATWQRHCSALVP